MRKIELSDRGKSDVDNYIRLTKREEDKNGSSREY